MHFSNRALFAVFLAYSSMAIATGDSDEAAPEPVELDPIVVVANKSPRPLSDVIGQVSVINAGFIERYGVENIDNLLRYEPGLNIEGSGTRFGGNAINIRGIGGNRVAIEVDGIPTRDRFAIGSYSDGGRILAETDRIKRVEVLYGPASTLYGSDALGGVIAVTTWDPDDLLAFSDDNSWYGLRGGYQSVNSSVVGSGVAAWGNDNNGILFAATWRDGHETENKAVAGTPQDTQDWDSMDYFLRYTHDTQNGNLLRITLNDYERNAKTQIDSLPGNGRFRRTTALSGDDSNENRQFSVAYEFDSKWGNGVVRAFDVESSTQQLTHEERAASVRPVRMERYFQYDQDISGIELNMFRDVSLSNSDHHFGAGIEFQRTDSEEFRDGFQQSLIDGSISNVILGEEMPVRDFPISRTDEWGIFIQDEISLDDGRWEIVPALRYDRYDLDPRPDDIYLGDNPSTEVVSVSEDEFSPRLGALFHINDEWGIYAQYVNGFRAPPFEDANIGLDIPLFNIRAIPNPDLKSETSQGFETGFRYITNSTRLTLAVFDTEYDDFIETKARVGTDPETGTILFQSRNIDRARIYGLDLRLEQNMAAWSQALENWSLTGAAYWSRGENRDTDEPLNSVSPPQAVLGVSWSSADGIWDANLTSTFTAKQDRIDETAGARFHTPYWATADLTAGWRINQYIDLRAGIYNLTDERYWRWSDVSLFRPDNPMLELLTRPGRNYSISARFQW
ncbi:MAG: TonB-dependent hemoglobin/transferrin/lactoferrin family receptor [Xanthomonadales bacterium]|nr:TonB-dependent hemoglobin/transferrin/lactoferrin family receptor [Xanthomonadales bacterium]